MPSRDEEYSRVQEELEEEGRSATDDEVHDRWENEEREKRSDEDDDDDD
jgi:hypothetical protein